MGRRKKGDAPSIRPRWNRRAYEVTIHLGGRVFRRHLATFDEVDRLGEEGGSRLLERRYHELMEELLDTTPRTPEARKRVRLSAAWKAWEEVSAATRSKGTLTYYARTLAELQAAAGDPPISQFGLREVDKLVGYLRSEHVLPSGRKAQPLSAASTNIRLNVLRAFLGWAQERGYIERIPRIRYLPREYKLPQVPTDEDLAALLHRLQHPPNEWLAGFYRLHLRAFMVAVGTGMRASEVFYLRWSDIDLEHGEIHVRSHGEFRIKERREKDVPMPPFLLAFLHNEDQERSKREVYLLDNGYGRLALWGPYALSVAFRRHYRAIGVPAERRPKAFHGFRALYATKLHEMGEDITTIRRLMGHRRLTTTESYLSDTRVTERRAASRLQFIGANAEPDDDDFLVKPRNTRADSE